MARPKKIGLDYFPMDVNLNDQIQALESLHENDGFTWIIKFWQAAYKTEHGEVNLGGLFGDISAKNSRITPEKQAKIIEDCLQLGLLHKIGDDVYVSRGVQKRMGAVSAERQKALKRRISSYKNSKVNKSIVKESKVKETPHCSGVVRQTTNEVNQPFEEARKTYKGTKRGYEAEFDNFTRKHPNWKEIAPLLLPAIQREIAHKAALTAAGQFCPQWKNFQTWVNQSCWTQEFGTVAPVIKTDGKPKHDEAAYQKMLADEVRARNETNQKAYEEMMAFKAKREAANGGK